MYFTKMLRFTQKNVKIQYANNFVHKLGMGYPTRCVYQSIYNEED